MLSAIAMRPLQHHHIDYCHSVYQQSGRWTRSTCPYLSAMIKDREISHLDAMVVYMILMRPHAKK